MPRAATRVGTVLLAVVATLATLASVTTLTACTKQSAQSTPTPSSTHTQVPLGDGILRIGTGRTGE